MIKEWVEMQLCINSQYDIIFEWILYNRFNDIKIIDKGDPNTIYSAIVHFVMTMKNKKVASINL